MNRVWIGVNPGWSKFIVFSFFFSSSSAVSVVASRIGAASVETTFDLCI